MASSASSFSSNETRRGRLVSMKMGRAFWMLMLLAHLPAAVGAWRSWIGSGCGVERLESCLFLSLSIVFFLLKLRGVSFLRLPCHRQSWVAVFLIVAILHVDCLPSGVRHALASDPVAILAVTSLAGGWLARRRNGGTPLPSGASSSGFSRERPPVGDVWMAVSRPHCWVLAAHVYALRAPPV